MENNAILKNPLPAAVPFIGGLPVANTMTASVGDHVTPGAQVEVTPGMDAGEGIMMSENGPIAVLSGRIVSNSGVISVDPSALPINSPGIGDIIIGEVNRLNEKTAEIRILHIFGVYYLFLGSVAYREK